MADEALRFAARARAARDQAVIGAAPVSLWVTAGGYGFDRREAGHWAPSSDSALRVERWSDGTRADPGSVDGRGRVRVIFDPTGLPDRAADVRLQRAGRAMLVRIGADGSVRADAQ
ncbi:GspH/FimT family pseudopilin [Sphingomonas sp.]|uniref:GspH/FimT family pseudopilin n=1 Tax=Sphingomonas sp. TaxID=28214 RepID=UPI003CC675E1